MQKNKRPPAGILLCLALGAFLTIRSAGYIREIIAGRKSIEQYRRALNEPLPADYLSRLEARAAELRAAELRAPETPEANPAAAPRTNPENPAAAIRDLLGAQGIGVERIRSLSTGGSAGTELTFSSAPVNFLRFLQGAAEFPFPLSYISIKMDDHSSNINVTVRHSHEP
jgi:hypothetical protein